QRVAARVEQHVRHVDDQSARRVPGLEYRAELLQKLFSQFGLLGFRLLRRLARPFRLRIRGGLLLRRKLRSLRGLLSGLRRPSFRRSLLLRGNLGRFLRLLFLRQRRFPRGFRFGLFARSFFLRQLRLELCFLCVLGFLLRQRFPRLRRAPLGLLALLLQPFQRDRPRVLRRLHRFARRHIDIPARRTVLLRVFGRFQQLLRLLNTIVRILFRARGLRNLDGVPRFVKAQRNSRIQPRAFIPGR